MEESKNVRREPMDSEYEQNIYRLEIDIRDGDYEENIDGELILPENVSVNRIEWRFTGKCWPDDKRVFEESKRAMLFFHGWKLHEIRGIYRV